MQIPEKSIRDTVQAIVDYDRRHTSQATNIFHVSSYFEEARLQLVGIRRLFNETSKIYHFVNVSLDEVDAICHQAVDRIRTQQQALEVDSEAFPAHFRVYPKQPADLGRSPVKSSAGAELEEAKQGQGGTHE